MFLAKLKKIYIARNWEDIRIAFTYERLPIKKKLELHQHQLSKSNSSTVVTLRPSGFVLVIILG